MTSPVEPATGRKEQILAAAADLFAARGFHGVSVNDIGDACGISGPAIYKHFRSKDEVLAASLVAISEYLLSGGRERRGHDPETSLNELIDFHIDFALEHPALIVIQEREWKNVATKTQQRVRELQLEYIDIWVEILRQLRPDVDKATARAAVQAGFGLLNSTPHSARISPPHMRALLTSMARSALLSSQ